MPPATPPTTPPSDPLESSTSGSGGSLGLGGFISSAISLGWIIAAGGMTGLGASVLGLGSLFFLGAGGGGGGGGAARMNFTSTLASALAADRMRSPTRMRAATNTIWNKVEPKDRKSTRLNSS